MNFKKIHIGSIVERRLKECGIEMSRICNFMKCSEKEIKEMYLQEDFSTLVLLKWSKLLEYDFFRIYSQHLILYAPPTTIKIMKEQEDHKISLPQFRKKLYTKEVIDFIISQIESKEMSRNEVIEKYRIPKTTLYKWINKHLNSKPDAPLSNPK